MTIHFQCFNVSENSFDKLIYMFNGFLVKSIGTGNIGVDPIIMEANLNLS